ncbi:tyrosine-type recombinase/integrase [Bacillus safensis]|uniref:tyrosine-type recombinase/integrase n=2 Tax=Bacillus safensis TaxID=561879 RepID=UPI00245364BA|nr:site-specific integrase [Bacillus safensis]MDH3097600.1 site-specific integrase [Bacillus safensis]
MKSEKSKKDDHLFSYYNAKKEKRWKYRFRYYDALGNRKEASGQGFTSENAAYRELLKVKSAVVNGEVKQVEHSNLTVDEWIDIWFDNAKNQWKDITIYNRKITFEKHIKPLLGRYKLRQLDKATYQRVFINKLLKKFEPSTVEYYHALFKIAINAAVDNEVINKNRFVKVKIKNDQQVEKPNDNFYTAAELKKFLDIVKSTGKMTQYTMILFLASTGARKGEAMGLRWSDIDFANDTITISRTRDSIGVRSPKTKNSYRTIKGGGELMNQLKLYRNSCKELKFSFGSHLKDDNYVFINQSNGKPVSDNFLNHAMKKVFEENDLKRITVHGLRHTHATILIGKKIPTRAIADRLGNTPEMIHRVYSHSFEELELETVHAFEDAMNL